jgi:hypothetical protein
MKAHQRLLTQVMTLIVGSVLCGLPEVAQAMPQQDAATPQSTQQNQNGTSIDPSQGPLQPVPSQNEPVQQNLTPPSPESSTDLLPATPAPQPKAQQQMQQPLGAATAGGVPVVGGAASRPAGEAIAPDKQRQRRSFLLKMGLIAAVGVAGGVVYGLSKGTSAKP